MNQSPISNLHPPDLYALISRLIATHNGRHRRPVLPDSRHAPVAGNLCITGQER